VNAKLMVIEIRWSDGDVACRVHLLEAVLLIDIPH